MNLISPLLYTDWHDHLHTALQTKSFNDTLEKVDVAYATTVVYPAKENIFSAFTATSFSSTKVVIIGQDPYHQPDQAHGLSFSVSKTEKIPPSLRNIFSEIKHDIGHLSNTSGNLSHWAAQGVLLLNTTLTVEENLPGSHHQIGWEQFTSDVIHTLSSKKRYLVFMLWGAKAQKLSSLLNENNHLILSTTHPSPLSAHRGFMGCNHFSKCNNYLKSKNILPIDW
jgi:uracil-DNA glycosylase